MQDCQSFTSLGLGANCSWWRQQNSEWVHQSAPKIGIPKPESNETYQAYRNQCVTSLIARGENVSLFFLD